MTDYVIDLGFDAEQSREYRGINYNLQAGLVKIHSKKKTGEGKAQWLTKLRSGDQLSFRVWNVSQVADNSKLLGLWVAFFEAKRPSFLVDPFKPNPLIVARDDLTKVDLEKVKTSVFDQVWDGWIVGRDSNSYLGRSFQLRTAVHPARCVLQARIHIRTRLKELRTYVFDPEMVVSPHEG